jgi:hypothetical protein
VSGCPTAWGVLKKPQKGEEAYLQARRYKNCHPIIRGVRNHFLTQDSIVGRGSETPRQRSQETRQFYLFDTLCKICIESMVICRPVPIIRAVKTQVINMSENKKRSVQIGRSFRTRLFLYLFSRRGQGDILKIEETNPICQSPISV